MRPDPLHILLLVLALYFSIISAACLLTTPGQAVELSISGNSAGQGLQNLSFAGDLLNVSIAQNGSAWNVTLGGRL